MSGRVDFNSPPVVGQALVIDGDHACIQRVEPDPGTELSGDIYVTLFNVEQVLGGEWVRYQVGGSHA